MTKEVPYDELDPGIRQVVRWLNENGFETTDSGDGKSKFAEDGSTMCCAMPHPNVVIVVPADQLVAECDRLYGLLKAKGCAPVPMGPDDEDNPGQVNLQATYESGSEGILLLLGLDDEGFNRGAPAP